MSNKKQKNKLKRKLKKKDLFKVEEAVKLQRKQNEINQIASERLRVEKEIIDSTRKNIEPTGILNYIADRNGCGYYRCVWPFELLATYRNIQSMNSYVYLYDFNYLRSLKVIRFQRQATNSQKLAWDKYIMLREQHGFAYKMCYEIDDLLMEIQPHNKIAFDFFDAEKKSNHMHMLKSADNITFSTEKLKEIYVRKYGINESKVHVIKNTLPQFMYNLPIRSEPHKFYSRDEEGNILKDDNDNMIAFGNPRILWSGSASHVGQGGDLEFLIPMIESTLDEYQWVFQGVVPPELEKYVQAGKIEFISWCPTYGLANVQFYRARPDICIAPLNPNIFNTCKSDLKYLECSAMGCPTITTSFLDTNLGPSPYDNVSEICLEPDADIWKSAIDHLVQNPDYYMEVVNNQYKNLNGRWMENYLDTWATSVGFSK